ncbi:MAG: S41 family peptidase [Candidatus Kapabacteria bacterium]|nr:S41 family peptidase [Ignavibacteriota bacterium]MCW5885565.1 S41 family peptidase [Candidatus Kapabacteria bacterium]
MKKKIGIVLLVAIASLLILGFTKDYYFKINKSFDVFGAVFREVTTNYVLEIDPEILIKGAIQGMLSTLDPYTEFYDIQDREDFDILTSGTYTGFGISISNIDSMLTVTQVRDGYSAFDEGIRIGDRICYVDDEYVLYKDYQDIRDFLKGDAGSKSNLRIIRDGNPDTLDFSLVRKSISLDNIGYYEILDDNTGYVKLERFNKTAAQDFRYALNELKRRGKLNSLIIDLRDNPGGLLEPAVQICDMFLPNGSLIVSTRGRDDEELYTYKSTSNPVEPDLPLVLLINENSASASEIIAGTLQDYDRAVIVGKRSYGKGLVQSILPMPYNGNLKITTAKYYIPSGRCIQRIKFAEKYIGNEKSGVSDSPDSTVFYTANGRKVFESTGINPDTTGERQVYAEVIADLYGNFHFFKFSNLYSSKLSKLPENFSADDKLFKQFIDYLNKQDYSFKSESDLIIDRISDLAKESGFSANFDKSLNSLRKSLAKEEEGILEKSKVDILMYLDYEIKSRFNSERDMFAAFMNIDNDLILARKILKSDSYSKILMTVKSKDF